MGEAVGDMTNDASETSSEDDRQPPARELPPAHEQVAEGTLQRNAKLLSIPLAHATRATLGLTRRARGVDAATVNADVRRATAEQVFRTLSELKGGAMKFGQALSMFEAMLPDDVAGPFREQLSRLQDSAAPMPTSKVGLVLSQQLGRSWRTLFSDFALRPAAAASIGQVHRATWAATGTPVAVKIQYPGADRALASDLRQLHRLATVIAPLTGGIDVRALIDELAARVGEEVDYLHEAAAQHQAATAFAGSPDFVVPAVRAAAPRVLVSDWVDGRPLSSFFDASQDDRNAAALAYARFLFAGPPRAGLLHADPHPGNFLMTADGRLGAVDFGLVAQLPDGFPPAMGRLLTAAARGDAAGTTAGLEEEGFVVRNVDPADLLAYVAPFVEPAVEPLFHFTRPWLRSQYERVSTDTMENGLAFNLNVPPSYALIHRVWLGGIAVLCQLDARADFGSVLREFLPGWQGR